MVLEGNSQGEFALFVPLCWASSIRTFVSIWSETKQRCEKKSQHYYTFSNLLLKGFTWAPHPVRGRLSTNSVLYVPSIF